MYSTPLTSRMIRSSLRSVDRTAKVQSSPDPSSSRRFRINLGGLSKSISKLFILSCTGVPWRYSLCYFRTACELEHGPVNMLWVVQLKRLWFSSAIYVNVYRRLLSRLRENVCFRFPPKVLNSKISGSMKPKQRIRTHRNYKQWGYHERWYTKITGLIEGKISMKHCFFFTTKHEIHSSLRINNVFIKTPKTKNQCNKTIQKQGLPKTIGTAKSSAITWENHYLRSSIIHTIHFV